MTKKAHKFKHEVCSICNICNDDDNFPYFCYNTYYKNNESAILEVINTFKYESNVLDDQHTFLNMFCFFCDNYISISEAKTEKCFHRKICEKSLKLQFGDEFFEDKSTESTKNVFNTTSATFICNNGFVEKIKKLLSK